MIPTPSLPDGGQPAVPASFPTSGVTEQAVWDTLRQCFDPEIPVNIVDLGLVYGFDIKGEKVDVRMTLTAPGCHLGGQIAGDVQMKLLTMDGVEEANVELVWDPPWNPSMISAAARKQLGLDPA